MTHHDFLDPPSKVGDLGRLGHYRVIDELGEGGMGFVFRAEDIKLKRAVALKVMNRKISATPNSRKRFIDEARAMAAVHHDNVVTIFEVGESKGTPFMAMEMLKGCTAERPNGTKTQLRFEEVIDYAKQIARGLAAAHQQGIIHRDIKPANIWIEADTGRIKILDFGLALASSPVDHFAGRGTVIGTPGYLSPEQARTDPLDDRSDLYSLGVVLYELCTGQLPLLAKSVPGQLISILAHRPKPVSELNPDIPQPLSDLIYQLLRKEPRSRPSSADMLCQELDRVEKECHAKSEVAQAINKLQVGLSEVVSKSNSNHSQFDLVHEPQTIGPDPFAPDPFAPDPLTPITDPLAPITDPLATLVSPETAILPAATASPKPAAHAPPLQRKSNEPSATTHWMSFWPLAALIAAVLIALPLLTYAFNGRGRTAYVIGKGDDSEMPNSMATSSNPINTDSPRGRGADPHTADPDSNHTSSNQPASGSIGPTTTPPGPNIGKGTQNRKRGNQGKHSRPNSKPVETNQNAATTRSATVATEVNRNTETNRIDSHQQNESRPLNIASTNMAAMNGSLSNSATEFSTTIPTQAATETTTQQPSDHESPSTAVEMTWTAISTDDGRGADAMVQNGTTQKFGLKLSIGVRRRGNIDSNHSYIRFDLAETEDRKNHVEDAELVLSVVGKKRPVGATLNVYGLEVGMWPEEELDWKKSFSPRGLNSHPLLASVEVTEQTDEPNREQNEIRIRDPKLASFLATSPEDIVTLALTGSASDGSLLRFVSREQSPKRAPTLRLLIPAVAPPQDQQSGQSKRQKR